MPTMSDMFAPHENGNVNAGWMESMFRARNRSIAVVGSSGNLLYQGHGPEIDSHGLIMRFNGAITKGYENDVGHDYDTGRTEGIIRAAWSVGYQEAREKGLLAKDELIVQGLEHMWADPYFSTHGRPSLRISAAWVRALHQDILNGAGDAPSTGFIGVAVALALARAVPPHGRGARNIVRVYGFGACPICGKYSDCVRSCLAHHNSSPAHSCATVPTPGPKRDLSHTHITPPSPFTRPSLPPLPFPSMTSQWTHSSSRGLAMPPIS